MTALMLKRDTPAPAPEQGVIEEARRRRRLRRARAGAAALAGLAVIGLISWAAAAGHSSGSGAAGSASRHGGATPRTAPRGGFGIRLSPALDGGQYGWCVGIEEPGLAGIAGGGCSATPNTGQPLSMVLSSSDATTRSETIVALTAPSVAEVLVGKRRIATELLPGLPYGLRAARAVLPLLAKRTPAGRVVYEMPPEPSLVALDSAGRPIRQSILHSRPEGGGLTHRGPCGISAAGVPGLAAQWSHVAARIQPFGGELIGSAFFSCIDTEYYLHGWPLDAAILLNAKDPTGMAAPIPGLAALPGSPGVVNGPGDFKGELTAKRIGSAWLVVAGGSGLAQRLDVLRHLRASISLAYRGTPEAVTPIRRPPALRPGARTTPADLIGGA